MIQLHMLAIERAIVVIRKKIGFKQRRQRSVLEEVVSWLNRFFSRIKVVKALNWVGDLEYFMLLDGRKWDCVFDNGGKKNAFGTREKL